MMDINEFEITKRENIIETDNLIPPDWYDESEGGYNYKFTLIEKGKNVTHPKEIYYGTAGSVLGYIDGSYYESCEDEDFRNNITDTECKWKFEVTKFFKTREMADWYEAWYLQSEGAQQSDKYYNNNNGFIKIVQGKNDIIKKLADDITKVSKKFMETNREIREQSFNYLDFIGGVRDKNVIQKQVPVQIPGRVLDTDVINSVYSDVDTALGDASMIEPEITFTLEDKVLHNETGGFYDGGLNALIGGNHREIGAFDAGATRMNFLHIPPYRIHNFTETDFLQLAILLNPEPKQKRQPTSEESYIKQVVRMSDENNWPFDHPSIKEFLKSCNLKKEKIVDIISKSKDEDKHTKNNTSAINWNAKGWKQQAKRVADAIMKKNPGTCCPIMSIEASKIETYVKANRKFKSKGTNKKPKTPKLLQRFNTLIYGKHSDAWTMWRTSETKGIKEAISLYDEMNLKNINGEKPELSFIELPSEHSSIGVNYKNFWTSTIGENWLKERNIVLEDEIESK
jgi:hypothetical protein|tara:strand:+ start:84 stop:1619 length:1536 start_codon:yes stop_codon:yes gene_type:complete